MKKRIEYFLETTLGVTETFEIVMVGLIGLGLVGASVFAISRVF